MSDIGRKGLGDKASEKLTPDSSKSTMDKASENATGAYDKVASAVQPDSDKSITQKAGDSVNSGADDAQKSGKGIVESTQETLGNLAGTASDQAKAAADYITGTAKDTTK